MKKLVSIGLVFIIAAFFCACGADKAPEETDLSGNTEEIKEAPGKMTPHYTEPWNGKRNCPPEKPVTTLILF